MERKHIRAKDIAEHMQKHISEYMQEHIIEHMHKLFEITH